MLCSGFHVLNSIALNLTWLVSYYVGLQCTKWMSLDSELSHCLFVIVAVVLHYPFVCLWSSYFSLLSAFLFS